MKTISELYRGYEITWKIVVSPKGLKDDNGVSPTVRFWTPRGQPQDKMLIYSPKIALSAKYTPKRYDDPEEYQNHESLNLPINMVYTFANRMRSVYQALADPKMFHKDASGNIIMDKNLAIQNSKKMSLYIIVVTGSDKDNKSYTIELSELKSPNRDIKKYIDDLNHILLDTMVKYIMDIIKSYDGKENEI